MSKLRILCCLAVALALVPLANARADAGAAFAIPGLSVPAIGEYHETVRIIPLVFDFNAGYEFSFDQSGVWQPLDTIITLDAFPGEIRDFSILLRRRSLSNAQIHTLTYRIDRSLPEPPRFKTLSGDVVGSLTLDFSSAYSVFYCIDGQDSFKQFDHLNPPRLQADTDRTRQTRVAAFAKTRDGRRSALVFADYRLLPEGFVPSFPFPKPVTSVLPPLELSEDNSALYSLEPLGRTNDRLIFRLVSDLPSLVAAVSTAANSTGIDSQLIPLRLSGGSTILQIPVPKDDNRSLRLTVAALIDGRLRGSTRTLNPAGMQTASTVSLPSSTAFTPELHAFANGFVLDWQDPFNFLYFAAADNTFRLFSEPVVIPSSAERTGLRWYSTNLQGQTREPSSLQAAAAKQVARMEISGIEHNGRYGRQVAAALNSAGLVRYSLTSEPVPLPVTTDSPLFPAKLELAVPENQRQSFILRMVNFDTEGQPGLERELRFTLSAIMPAPPVIRISPLGNDGSGFSIELDAEAGSSAYYSASSNGTDRYQLYQQPVHFTGSGAGRENFVIKAYIVDSYGNRSARIAEARYTLDPFAIYVDSAVTLAGDGSPMAPCQNLEQALALASGGKRRIINLRGNFRTDSLLKFSGNLNIVGGLGENWEVQPGVASFISFVPNGKPEPIALSLSDGRVGLDGLVLQLDAAAGSAALIQALNAEVELRNATVRLSGNSDGAWIKTANSTVAFYDSTVELLSGATSRLFDLSDSGLVLHATKLMVPATIRFFELVSARKSRVRLEAVHGQFSPLLSFGGFLIQDSELQVKDTVLSLTGGTSSARLIRGINSSVELFNCYVSSDWQGSAELVILESRSQASIAFSTILLNGFSASLYSGSASFLQVFNSIVHSGAGSSTLAQLRNEAGLYLSASNFWGFTAYMRGSVQLSTLDGVNAYARNLLTDPLLRLYPLFSPVQFKANFEERTDLSLVLTGKGLRTIAAGSKGIGYAVPFGTNAYRNIGHQDR